MIGLIVHLPVAEGKQAEFEDVAKGLMAKVKANEPGCLVYSLFKVKGSETDYYFQEQYVDRAALDAHGKTPYFQEAFPKLGACLAGKPEMKLMDAIE